MPSPSPVLPVSKDELERAFAHYQSEVVRAGQTGDWSIFADLFTEDATYVEHLYGRFEGRDAIRSWITRTMSAFPGNAMPAFPVKWYVVDEDRGWIVAEIINRMEDPGDGSVHEASNITILHYAGDNQFSLEEDVYNPMEFMHAVKGWAAAAGRHDRLSPEAAAWLASVG